MSAEAIARDEYRQRRRQLMEGMPEDAVALVPAATARRRNRDVDYVFRQDSDFWYLTGFSEPDALLVLVPRRAEGEAVLFCQDRDERQELYNGERLGPQRAPEILAVDQAHPVGEIASVVPDLLEGARKLCVTLGDYPDFDRNLLRWVSSLRAREASGVVSPGEFIGLKSLLHEQRLIKSATEQRLLARAAGISADAHVRAMRACRAGMNETQLEAELVYAFMQGGARTPAYPPIVGGGANACVLHYIANSACLRDGDLVLIDAGCELEHYAADLTRTFPVGGRFSGEQRALYEIVLEAQQRAVGACLPGADFDRPHEVALRAMVEGLISLGLLEGSLDELLENEGYTKFCPHRSCHWLGLDVHDVGDYRVDGRWRKLEAGMALTVEPGIYVQPRMEGVDDRWRGIGIRIEDDVLIGRDAPMVLTAGAPKAVADIEAAMSGA